MCSPRHHLSVVNSSHLIALPAPKTGNRSACPPFPDLPVHGKPATGNARTRTGLWVHKMRPIIASTQGKKRLFFIHYDPNTTCKNNVPLMNTDRRSVQPEDTQHRDVQRVKEDIPATTKKFLHTYYLTFVHIILHTTYRTTQPSCVIFTVYYCFDDTTSWRVTFLNRKGTNDDDIRPSTCCTYSTCVSR